MKSFGDFHLNWFGSDEYEGWSGFQLIETSNISFHTTLAGDFFLDVFSCKEYNPMKIFEVITEFFQPKKIIFENFLRRTDEKLTTLDDGKVVDIRSKDRPTRQALVRNF